ncbi:MAG: DUF2267 domain-containing protein [Dehalococcoidia bacterium]
MTVPTRYTNASRDFELFLLDARTEAGLVTSNQTYTMVQGVLQAFRRRLTVEEGVRFAAVLPPILCALFVADWDLEQVPRAFEDRVTMTREVQSLRADHNWAPDHSIRAVATALRRHVDEVQFEAVLARLPAGAAEFWLALPTSTD